jgi:precorrin-6A synthase (deacetylating)
LLAWEHSIARELGEQETGAILVWGDPCLYDSTLRLLERLTARAAVRFEYEVIAGISSPQALAARHKLTLNRVGGAVHITTGRRLARALPADADDVVVMLDGECAFQHVPEAEYEIYWSAYLGSEQCAPSCGRSTAGSWTRTCCAASRPTRREAAAPPPRLAGRRRRWDSALPFTGPVAHARTVRSRSAA